MTTTNQPEREPVLLANLDDMQCPDEANHRPHGWWALNGQPYFCEGFVGRAGVPVTPTPAEPRERVDHADMRIEVVKRELNQGALAGFDSSVTAYAAHLVVAALDSYDAAALKAEYERGVQHGKVVQTIFGDSTEKLQAEYERGKAEGQAATRAYEEGIFDAGVAAGLRQVTEGWERVWGIQEPDLRGGYGHVLRCEDEEHAREVAAEYPDDYRLVSRLVGPWEPAEQPEPAPTAPAAVYDDGIDPRWSAEMTAEEYQLARGQSAEQPEGSDR